MRLLSVIIMIVVAGCKQESIQTGETGIEDYLNNNLPGWTLIDTADYARSWWSFYDKKETHNSITLDFNDDRIADHALLLKKDSSLRLVVLLGSGNKSYTHFIVDDFQPVYNGKVKDIQYGLAVEPPAQIDVLEPEEKSLILLFNAITLLDMEDRARIYYWRNNRVNTLYAK